MLTEAIAKWKHLGDPSTSDYVRRHSPLAHQFCLTAKLQDDGEGKCKKRSARGVFSKTISTEEIVYGHVEYLRQSDELGIVALKDALFKTLVDRLRHA